MTPRTLHTCRALPLVVLVMTALATPVHAQQQDDERACRQAAAFLDNTAHAAPSATDPGRQLTENRQWAMARIVICGAIGGEYVARTIRDLRTETDTAVLNGTVGGYSNLRDAAVFEAALEVARDGSASVPARVFALRTLWVLATGKYWIGYDRMLPDHDSTPTLASGRCESGLYVTDAKPFWYKGSPLPTDFATRVFDTAAALWKDPAQPINVRSAASCVLSNPVTPP